jgi:predicted enzyme related to lactoylglutathione lyase
MEKWLGTDSKDTSSSSSNMEYWIISTTDSKGNKASIGGGMMKRQEQHQHITNFIDVNSVDEYSSMIKKLGGKVVVSKMAVPGMGYFAVCHDTENNSFGIWESNESAK